MIHDKVFTPEMSEFYNKVFYPGSITIREHNLSGNIPHGVVLLTPQEYMRVCKTGMYEFQKHWGRPKIKTKKLRSIIRKAKHTCKVN